MVRRKRKQRPNAIATKPARRPTAAELEEAEDRRTDLLERIPLASEYRIPAGTLVRLRRPGAAAWEKLHRTARDVVADRIHWQGEGCTSFVVDGWEVKVQNSGVANG